jgi:BirA family biotin operon repressor/biotin-[acetyl-CoA-carboxylase] ligase
LTEEFPHWLELWREGEGFEAIREAWLARAGPVGERLAVNAGAEPVEGAFAGLDADGALLLRDPQGQTRRFSYGDVTLAG